MLRFLAQSLLTLLGNALGLLAAAALLSDFHITGIGFMVSVGFFTVVHILFSPFIFKMAIKYIPAISGGIALVTTFVSLILTTAFTSGLRIDSLATWFIAPFIIWLITVIAGVLLPLFLFKKVLAKKATSKRNTPTTLS